MASADWIEDSMRYHGKVLMGEFAHWCGEWDALPIDETCSEFAACPCYAGNPKANRFREQRRDEIDLSRRMMENDESPQDGTEGWLT